MKRIEFWFDPVSPYACLAFEHLPEALEGCSYAVEYRPVLFAGLLAHWGQKGPAEMAPKRHWTYRQVAWQAHRLGIALDLPAVHPFNSLPLLRLALAAGPNRRVVEAVMRHAWRGGADAADPTRLAALRQDLAPARDPGSDEVKAALRAQTDAAIARGVFGVPTFDVDGQCFWGLDALPMLRAWLQGDPWYDGRAWADAGAARAHVDRPPPK